MPWPLSRGRRFLARIFENPTRPAHRLLIPISVMAKAPNSAIGVDLGRYSLKSVLLQKKGPNRFVLTHYATHPYSETTDTVETLTRNLKALLKEMGGSAKACAIGVSS